MGGREEGQERERERERGGRRERERGRETDNKDSDIHVLDGYSQLEKCPKHVSSLNTECDCL